MDSGSYSNVRRGATPASGAASNASSYKANVNRTKTRKWVEAKVQSYDGDDWGNDYDDYEDGDGEPEPPPPPPPTTRLMGPRQLGPSGHQLPSSRTFSQPATSSLPSSSFGQLALRNPGGTLPLRVQTQPMPPHATESVPPAAASPRTSLPQGSKSAGPAPVLSKFPPRKSSMGQKDRPEIDGKIVSKPDSQSGSSSGSRPLADQRSAFPRGAPTPESKTLSAMKPSDIYKKMSEENEKARPLMVPGQPSMDNAPGHTEAPSSLDVSHPPGEQFQQGSPEGHDAPKFAHAQNPTLAPVAEQKRDYGTDSVSMDARTGQLPAIHESSILNHKLSPSQGEPNDEVKADLVKTRRFSTSPQLPTLTRVSGFGDDFFSSPGGYSPLAGSSSKLQTPSEEQWSTSNEANTVPVLIDSTQRQPAYTLNDTSPEGNLITTKHRNSATTSNGIAESGSTRPQIPGGWVSESTIAPVPSEQPTPLEKQEPQNLTGLANAQTTSVSPITESDAEPSDLHHVTGLASLPSSIHSSDDTSNSDGANQSNSRQFSHAAEEYSLVPRSLSPLKTGNSFTQPTPRPTPPIRDQNSQIETSLTAQPPTTTITRPEFSPTAPLNSSRAQAGQADFISLTTQQRQTTTSTIDTASPEKESDKLREEIIKSLSPTPVSPISSNLPSRGTSDAKPTPGSLTRESTYLAGVYDDYISSAEEKALQVVGQAPEKPAQMGQSPSTNWENGPSIGSKEISASQSVPPSSENKPAPGGTTRLRRFSWQHEPEEVVSNPVELKSPVSTLPQDLSTHGRDGAVAGSNANKSVASPVTDSLQVGSGVAGTILHQDSQISGHLPGNTSITMIEPPSARRLKPNSNESSTARLSLADEKEMVLIGDAQSTTSSASEQHPALISAPEQGIERPPSIAIASSTPPVQTTVIPTPFREILNLPTCEERVQKFEQTREQFYVIESGLPNWLTHMQGQLGDIDTITSSNINSFITKTGAQPTTYGAPGAPQLPHKIGTAASNPRRTSMGNVQQLMASQSSSFGASSNQVGTKSKELFHAAGAIGNKGMKSGMKLFNKGKSKLRERTAGDKAFF
ncbi:hypothetical protein SAMD00023353_2001150 [Rosellinia necatrix]|uniref:Uncharacterized protein n=1 Tax=Rosellinia necatrix TaxID=77044 RepID=A0A1W2TF03_ROSNE|nr:hypothetical protein SAMD00023353_2001150 [Rosellinia necatrix]